MTLEELATEELRKAGGSPEKAVVTFARIIQKNRNLRKELCLGFLRSFEPPAAEPERAEAKPGKPEKPSIQVRAHKRRTPEEKAAADKAWLLSANAIYERRVGDRKLGDIAWHELSAFAHDAANEATSYLVQGMQTAENAVLCGLIRKHCSVTDENVLVRDCIKPNDLQALADRARELTPKIVHAAQRRAARQIENHEDSNPSAA